MHIGRFGLCQIAGFQPRRRPREWPSRRRIKGHQQGLLVDGNFGTDNAIFALRDEFFVGTKELDARFGFSFAEAANTSLKGKCR